MSSQLFFREMLIRQTYNMDVRYRQQSLEEKSLETFAWAGTTSRLKKRTLKKMHTAVIF